MLSNKQERCSKSNPRSEIVIEHHINDSEWTSLFLSIFLKKPSNVIKTVRACQMVSERCVKWFVQVAKTFFLLNRGMFISVFI